MFLQNEGKQNGDGKIRRVLWIQGFHQGMLLDLAATVTKMGVYYSNLTSQDIHETIFSCYIVTTKKDLSIKKRLCV